MFLTKKEKKISQEYLNKGFVIQDINNINALNWISNFFLKNIKGKNNFKKNEDFLNNIHKKIKVTNLNDFRLNLIKKMNQSQTFRENFYQISKNLVDMVVGNEVVMQKNISLSIQMPKDDSSLLPVHADTWTGVSPYESVIWLPLVNCFNSKSMFILPANKLKKIKNIFKDKKILNSDDIFKKIKKDIIWLNVKFGQVVIFDHSLPHGNIINKEKETRWSMNCRFKSIFTPYRDKKLGEYYEPITLKPASKRGMEYKFPK